MKVNNTTAVHCVPIKYNFNDSTGIFNHTESLEVGSTTISTHGYSTCNMYMEINNKALFVVVYIAFVGPKKW